jgi:hypothetical protein
MAGSRPICDRHMNLQMILCSLKRPSGQSHGYVCPVPGCGRHFDDEGYFDVVEAKALQVSAPKNRRDAARAAVLRAIRDQRPPILPDKQR